MPLRVFHQLQRAHAGVFRAADRRLKAEFGLTSAQQAILFHLAEEDGSPISAIADALNMGKSSLTGLVDRMAARGLVRRASDDADGRVIRINLTPEGARRVRETATLTKAINADLLAEFTHQEQAVIARFLSFLADDAGALIEKGAASNTKQSA
ncbi:MAG: MarR family winged helix-turn-helix transcriptional regulator [Pseudomonadota bacterium]